jgi:hypothetical protein
LNLVQERKEVDEEGRNIHDGRWNMTEGGEDDSSLSSFGKDTVADQMDFDSVLLCVLLGTRAPASFLAPS